MSSPADCDRWITYFLVVVSCVTYALCNPEISTNITSPSHPGAARQMFGSSSLRDIRNKDPILSTGQRKYGVRTTIKPKIMPFWRWTDFPLPPAISYSIPWPVSKTQTRSGLTGLGKQVAVTNDEYGMISPGQSIHYSSCANSCANGMVMCAKNCTCVHARTKCDSAMECDPDEELDQCDDQPERPMLKCDETKNFVPCPKTRRCISKEWLCDGDDDCGDFFDETRCGYQHNCTSDQVQCENGLCIPKLWMCDNDNDCRDFSDEINCTKIGCSSDEFECNDGTCVTLNWKCDHQVDCPDGSDERECELIAVYCNDKEFQCNNHKCIRREFRCDGDDDCDDWSDEKDCITNLEECELGEYRCKKGQCIPKRWLCDNQKDCANNDDEEMCSVIVKKPCNSDEYTCQGGQCILNIWLCDGSVDCPNGEDEKRCNITCNEAEIPCTGPGINDTYTESCILKKRRCDGQNDCPNGDDERDCPAKRDCEPKTKCEQLCVTYANGQKGCSCRNGFKLDKNGYTCNDIDECLYATNPVCSQNCNNTIGSFKCGCMTGYVLRPDLRTCKAVGGSPTLLFANRIDIRQVSLSNSKYLLILKGMHNVISLDYHYTKQLLFYTDVSTDKIRRSAINGTGVTTIVNSGLESPGGIAVDWIHDLVFWTDSGTKRVEVANLDGTHRAILIANELDKPRAIVVHPGEASIFWTDWGPNPKIERAELDGSNRRSIITESLFWPNGLTVDYTARQLYWTDAKHNVIECSLFDGSKRRRVVTKSLAHPFAITIFEDAIFWTDWHTKSIATANKLTGAGYRALHSELHFPMDIHTYHPQRQPKFKNRCGNNNGGCEHLCLPNRRGYVCVCRMGQKLKADKRTCHNPEKFIIFTRRKDIRIKHLDGLAEKQYEMVLPLNDIKNAVSIAWDSKSNYIFWSDIGMKYINRAFWNGSDHEIIAYNNIVAPKGLAYDWATDKLYWTDANASRIEVATSDGTIRTLLIWENLEKPGDIAVDPLSGLMFWTDLGETKRIEKAHMDGSNRVILVATNISTPCGVSVDHVTGKLYWTDADLRTISFINFDGTGRKTLLRGAILHYPYGLDVYEDYVYWSDLISETIERANKVTGENRTVMVKNMADPMGLKVFHRDRKNIRTPCTNGNNGGCSHLCLLKPKGHFCACPTGVTLNDDKKTCNNGPLNYLIVAHRLDIRQISLDVPYMADVVLPFPNLKLATSVDVDRKTGEIYWTDTAEDCIQKSYANGTNRNIIVTREIESPDGIAVDSTGRKIYWTDAVRNSIEVAELNGTNRKVLFNTDIEKPRAITLHYHHGLMFWSDWGNENPKIEVAHMDGTNRKTLISKNITWPNGLAIDRPEGRLYWNDAKRNTIESCDLKGKNRRLVLNNLPHPYGLVLVGSHIYWTDWSTKALHRADKETGDESTIIRGNLDGLMDVRSVQYDNIAENACGDDNGGCSHLCLRNPKGYTCACPTGLSKSKIHPKHCEPIPETFLLIAARYSISQISLDTGDVWDVSLPINDDMQNVIDVNYHYKKKLIFYIDIGRNVIQSVSMYNMSDVRTVIGKNLSSPDGIAVDWLADNIYWTNTGNKVIEVARLDGSSRKTIVSKLKDPRSLACNPKGGYLYWSDWNPHNPTIERCHLDGSNRRSIISDDLSYPTGIVIDFTFRRLYWVDAKPNEERIQTSDYHGLHRVTLSIDKTHPFSLTQYREWLFWTDWIEKCIVRAEKNTGNDRIVVRPMYAVTGITIVSDERQPFWNPCSVNNGNCSHLCFFKKKDYTCGCPDKPTPGCSTIPRSRVSNICPKGKGYDCPIPGEIDYVDEDDPDLIQFKYPTSTEEPNIADKTSAFYVITLVPMIAIVITSIAVVAYILIKRGKKNYMYGASRSFSNPNYYSNDPGAPQNGPDRKQFIWKRLKYDKSQERVYEETVVASPEVTSLIPTILTPCSSNCETVTPEMERSPSVTPLHKIDIQ